VTYERAPDAKKAIKEYHGAWLDDKVLTVEFDIVMQSPNAPPKKEERGAKPQRGGKTLKVTK
jgi:hypothetical protein